MLRSKNIGVTRILNHQNAFIKNQNRTAYNHDPVGAASREINYNYQYPRMCYHLVWDGPTNMKENIYTQIGDEIGDEPKIKTERDHIGNAVELFTQYDEESYEKCINYIRQVQDVKTTKMKSRWEDAFYENDSIQYQKTFCPKFNSSVIRSILYILQGVEANLDLASKKRNEFRTTVQVPFVTNEYKIPGKRLMSGDQLEEYFMEYLGQLLIQTEMPPVYIPKKDSDFEYKFQRNNGLFEMVDGSNFVMTDVSADMEHSERPILVREGRTGRLRDADQRERNRRIECYYPSKYSGIQIPRYIDVDHIEHEAVLQTLIDQHGEYGPIQVMEAAVAYYQLDDERYYRLRMRVNDLLMSQNRFDDFYASRHFGQFIISMIETKQISNRVFVDHLLTNRDGDTLTAELRAFLVLLEIWESPETSDQAVVLERIFNAEAEFNSTMIEEIFPVEVPKAFSEAVNPVMS